MTVFLRNMIVYLNEKYKESVLNNVKKIDMPSASMVLMRERNECIEILSLGDCTVIVERNSHKVEVIHNARVSELDNSVVEKMKIISKKKNISILQTRRFVIRDLVTNRAKKNTRDGYHILGFDQLERKDLEISVYKKSEIKNICMFTDGIADYYEIFKLEKDVYEFYNKVKDTMDLKAILNEIRKYQNNDLSCDLYPRLKVKDDATIVRIEL